MPKTGSKVASRSKSARKVTRRAQQEPRPLSETAHDVWTLRLYITGQGARSKAALANLERLCREHLDDDRYEIEVIDLMKYPHLAKADQILAIPTLVRKVPEPIKRVIGDLSNEERALIALDLQRKGEV